MKARPACADNVYGAINIDGRHIFTHDFDADAYMVRGEAVIIIGR